jgi:hypothetical protein
MRRIVWLAVPFLIASSAGGQAVAASGSTDCPSEAGFVAGPFVPDATTAAAIYVAVERARFNRDLARYPKVTVTDRRDHWSVFRYPRPTVHSDGSITVVRGGGQLEMEIDKCSGTISRVHFSK